MLFTKIEETRRRSLICVMMEPPVKHDKFLAKHHCLARKHRVEAKKMKPFVKRLLFIEKCLKKNVNLTERFIIHATKENLLRVGFHIW